MLSPGPSNWPGRDRSGSHPVVVVMGMVMMDAEFFDSVIFDAVDAHATSGSFSIREFDGMRALIGSFNVTGGNSFREAIRFTGLESSRLWTNCWWLKA